MDYAISLFKPSLLRVIPRLQSITSQKFLLPLSSVRYYLPSSLCTWGGNCQVVDLSVHKTHLVLWGTPSASYLCLISSAYQFSQTELFCCLMISIQSLTFAFKYSRSFKNQPSSVQTDEGCKSYDLTIKISLLKRVNKFQSQQIRSAYSEQSIVGNLVNAPFFIKFLGIRNYSLSEKRVRKQS